jgi:hypothetical protein
VILGNTFHLLLTRILTWKNSWKFNFSNRSGSLLKRKKIKGGGLKWRFLHKCSLINSEYVPDLSELIHLCWFWVKDVNWLLDESSSKIKIDLRVKNLWHLIIWFFGIKSWFFTRNAKKYFAPPSARRNFFTYSPP